MACTWWRQTATTIALFMARFAGADSLAVALQQPCWRAGLACRYEDDSDGEAVVMQGLETLR